MPEVTPAKNRVIKLEIFVLFQNSYCVGEAGKKAPIEVPPSTSRVKDDEEEEEDEEVKEKEKEKKYESSDEDSSDSSDVRIVEIILSFLEA